MTIAEKLRLIAEMERRNQERAERRKAKENSPDEDSIRTESRFPPNLQRFDSAVAGGGGARAPHALGCTVDTLVRPRKEGDTVV